MAQGATTIFAKSVLATAAITQYRGVNLAGAVPAAGAAGYLADTGAAIGDMVTVNMLGTAIGESGAAYSANTLLEFDSVGRLIAKTTGVSVARSISAATAAGQLLEVVLLLN
jgi:hypothetical protein